MDYSKLTRAQLLETVNTLKEGVDAAQANADRDRRQMYAAESKTQKLEKECERLRGEVESRKQTISGILEILEAQVAIEYPGLSLFEPSSKSGNGEIQYNDMRGFRLLKHLWSKLTGPTSVHW